MYRCSLVAEVSATPLLGPPPQAGEEARWDDLLISRAEGSSARTDSGRRSCALRGS
jgi:hypothetical protein